MFRFSFAAALTLSLILTACGGSGNDSGDDESRANDSSNPMQKYAGLWKSKNTCAGPASNHSDTFVNGKYVTVIYENTIDSQGNLSSRIYNLWFKNPACTGIGERSPDNNSTNEKSVCSKHLSFETIAGKNFDKVGRCDLPSATSLQRIHNGELELTDDNKGGVATLVFVKYL